MNSQRLLDRISPLWLGIAISITLLLFLLLSETLLGRWYAVSTEISSGSLLSKVNGGALRDFRIAFVLCLIAGYLPAALLKVLRSGKHTVLILQNSLDCSPIECQQLSESIRLNRRWLIATGLIGLLFSLSTPYIVPPIPEAPWNPTNWSPEVTWHRTLGPFTTVWGLWLGYAIVSVSLRMSRIAKKLNRIDLLDITPLNPFTQQGLANALLVVGAVSIWSLILIESGFGLMVLLIGCFTLFVAALSLFAPVYGVHRRILQEKQREMSWLDKEIAKLRNTLPDPTAIRHSGEMADLISYRGLVDSIAEWPFTSSTYTRLLLYTLLPLLTWGLGVIAEQLISELI